MIVALKKYQLLRLFLCTLPFLLLGCGKGGGPVSPPAAQPVQVDVLIIHPDTFALQTESSGTVLAGEFVELHTEVSGRVVELHINEGASVASGSLLVKLNDEDLRAQLKKYNAQLQIADKNVARLKSLLEIGGVNQQDYDQALSTAEGLSADIDFVNAQIKKTELRAPFSGVLGLRNVSPGAYITPQQTIATLQQTNTLKVDFVLPESQSSMVKQGMNVSLEAGDKTLHQARVVAIEPLVNEGTRNVKFRAEVISNNSGLRSGAFVKVKVKADPMNDAVLIPTNSIIADSRDKKVALIKNGKVKMQVIQTGYRDEKEAQVLSGIQMGDTLAISGLLFLKPDAPVKVRSVK